jgi:hypothetical protein
MIEGLDKGTDWVSGSVVSLDPSVVVLPAEAIPWGVLVWVCIGILAGAYLMYRYMTVKGEVQNGKIRG